MNLIQTTLQVVEVGKGQVLTRIVPLVAALLIVCGGYNMLIYRGLSDAQSMDNAQLARQIVRHQGYTTKFLRPQAVAQLRDYWSSLTPPRDLFPPGQFPAGIPRVVPDTYNAPGYPCLLAVWFYFVHPEFEQVTSSIMNTHMYAGDRWIPPLNQVFLVLTGLLVFILARRLFDERVAWMSLVAFLGTDLVWRYTLTALSTNVLMFLITAFLICALEIFCVSEECFANEDRSFAPAWLWGFIAAALLVVACLTRLHLLVLLVPLFVLLLLMPRPSLLLFAVIALVVIGLVTPWFLRVYNISGNPLGSNFALLLYGEGDYSGNQIYATTSIPSYEQLFREASTKETTGFRWHFEHAWSLLGSNPLILFFAAALLHQFKRRRAQMFTWLLFGCAFALVVVNNLGMATPETIDTWNTPMLLFPGMLVIGSAFFFILLDRLNLQMRLLHSMIIVVLMTLTIMPLGLTLIVGNNNYYSFPPYMPHMIKMIGQYAEPDEWVTTDMPWATAWYADRASLWLPDSISDFENLNSKVCPTGVLMLTPVSWSQPVSNFTTGEYKDWLPLVAGLPLPDDFPLTSHTLTAPPAPNYKIWSDHPRWQVR